MDLELHKAQKKHLLHSNTLNHTSFRVLTSIGILKGCNQFSANTTNAHAHAPPPQCKTYLRTDAAIKEFFEQIHKKKLKDDEALPITRMLQGYPEASTA